MTAKSIISNSILNSIGQAIIDKGGASAPMLPSAMPAAIANIPSGFSLPIPASAYYEASLTHFYDIWENGGDGVHIENASTICDLVDQLDMTVTNHGQCSGAAIHKMSGSSPSYAAVADSQETTTGDRSAEVTLYGNESFQNYDVIANLGGNAIIGFHSNGAQFVFNATGSYRWDCDVSIANNAVHTITANYSDGVCVSAFVDGFPCTITSTSTSFSVGGYVGLLPYDNGRVSCSSLRLYSGHRTISQHTTNHLLDVERFGNE